MENRQDEQLLTSDISHDHDMLCAAISIKQLILRRIYGNSQEFLKITGLLPKSLGEARLNPNIFPLLAFHF